MTNKELQIELAKYPDDIMIVTYDIVDKNDGVYKGGKLCKTPIVAQLPARKHQKLYIGAIERVCPTKNYRKN